MKDNRTKQIKVYLNEEEYTSYQYLKSQVGLNMNQFFRAKLSERYKQEYDKKEDV